MPAYKDSETTSDCRTFSKSDSSEVAAPLERQFSGLYAYDVPTNCWTLLRQDCSDVHPGAKDVRSRIGHSMLFYPVGP